VRGNKRVSIDSWIPAFAGMTYQGFMLRISMTMAYRRVTPPTTQNIIIFVKYNTKSQNHIKTREKNKAPDRQKTGGRTRRQSDFSIEAKNS
jgi:hypothetical protein